jgi:hypothetical protein
MDFKTDGAGDYYMVPIGQYFTVSSEDEEATLIEGAENPTSLKKYFESAELNSMKITAQANKLSNQFLIISTENPTTNDLARQNAPSFDTRNVETKNFDYTKAYAFTSDIFEPGDDAVVFLIYVEFCYKCRKPKITPGLRVMNPMVHGNYVMQTMAKPNFSIEDEEIKLKNKLKVLAKKKSEGGF